MPFFFLALGVFLLDQATKRYVVWHMTLNESLPVIPGVFHITYIRNAGAAFGLLQNRTWLFLVVAVVLAILALYFLPRLSGYGPLFRWGLALLLGGAAGNAWDRLHGGVVIDFFDFRIWPVFNIADMAIVAGVAIVLYGLYRGRTGDVV